jgi:hypothetical protein
MYIVAENIYMVSPKKCSANNGSSIVNYCSMTFLITSDILCLNLQTRSKTPGIFGNSIFPKAGVTLRQATRCVTYSVTKSRVSDFILLTRMAENYQDTIELSYVWCQILKSRYCWHHILYEKVSSICTYMYMYMYTAVCK